MLGNIRIIARLDIKGPNVVKPVQTDALRVVGDPRVLAEKYYAQGIDEILYVDVVASLYQRTINFNLLKDVSQNIFVPITVAGRIRSIEDIQAVLRAGADKVAINTYAIENPHFLSLAVREFGSQCIVLSVEAKKREGNWEAYTEGGREQTGLDVSKWVREAINLGVGEVLITSIDKDGTRKGYDLDLVREVTSFASVPVIAHGGAKNPESIYEVITKGKADAVSASSIFHYDECTVDDIKIYLNEKEIQIRLK